MPGVDNTQPLRALSAQWGERPSLRCGEKSLDLSAVAVMGVLNITPDSFFDGGQFYQSGGYDLSSILHRAEALVAGGADILDVGGESTRPGSQPVSLQRELDRVVPVVEAITARLETIVSVDTSKSRVIAEVARVGAGLINDVRALRSPGALAAAAAAGLPVCLMHMHGEPGTMQSAPPSYGNVVQEVLDFLEQRAEECIAAGVSQDQILIDPGFGFGKTLQHNLLLMRDLSAFLTTGYPVLVGVSRKSMIGAVTGRPVAERLPGSLALAAMAVMQGAAVVRVHDVAETSDVVAMVRAVIDG